VARGNAIPAGVSDRIEWVAGDLLAPVEARGPFDAILANPPYIPTDEIATLEPGVRDYEPSAALDGGADGLCVVARLIEQAGGLLRPGGVLILEIGTAQEGPVRGLIDQRGVFEVAPTLRDAANHPRVVWARRA
jgi:release factor glutamine methyltransferase